jgi:hypothetical protein
MPGYWLEVGLIRKVLRPADSIECSLVVFDPTANAELAPKFHVALLCFTCSPHNGNINISPYVVALPMSNQISLQCSPSNVIKELFPSYASPLPGRTGTASEPSKPERYFLPPTCGVKHCHSNFFYMISKD